MAPIFRIKAAETFQDVNSKLKKITRVAIGTLPPGRSNTNITTDMCKTDFSITDKSAPKFVNEIRFPKKTEKEKQQTQKS